MSDPLVFVLVVVVAGVAGYSVFVLRKAIYFLAHGMDDFEERISKLEQWKDSKK